MVLCYSSKIEIKSILEVISVVKVGTYKQEIGRMLYRKGISKSVLTIVKVMNFLKFNGIIKLEYKKRKQQIIWIDEERLKVLKSLRI